MELDIPLSRHIFNDPLGERTRKALRQNVASPPKQTQQVNIGLGKYHAFHRLLFKFLRNAETALAPFRCKNDFGVFASRFLRSPDSPT